MSLRKAAKANWHYDCRLCEYTSPAYPDQFRAEERGLHHEQGGEHVGNVLAAAVKPIGEAIEVMVDAFASMINNTMDSLTAAFDQMSYALAPPPNVPHDPNLRSDKRVWGGR